jgi:hypothetical protein
VCRYAVVQVTNDEATESGKLGKVLALRHDLNDAYVFAEAEVIKSGQPVEIFERISKGKPTTQVAWEGRRRPGAGA